MTTTPLSTLTIEPDFVVAPTGNDTNPGTETSPFATPAAARDAVRERIANGLSTDIVVRIHEGTYRMQDTFVLGPLDSGSAEYSVTYESVPGETVVLDGGRLITGWRLGAGAIWTTEIPEVKAGHWYFRQLFVNGERAVRARTPNPGDDAPWWTIASSTANKDNPPAENEPITINVSGPVAAYANPSDVELVYMQNNESGRKILKHIDEHDQSFTLATPNRWNPKAFVADWPLSIPFAGKPCYLENALEMLDRPGEWYLDRQTGVLHYWPRPGEDMTKTEVVAPVVQNTLLALAGTPDQPIVNVHFKGLHVRHVDWPLPAWGYMPLFCCNVGTTDGPTPGHRPIEAAVEFSHAHSCSFSDGEISRAGGMGLCLREGTADITIEGSEIAVLGGGGVAMGWPNSGAGYLDAALPPAAGEYSGYRIANNHIHHCGLDYFGACGIIMMGSANSVISHNLIHDTAYFGIGVAGSQDPRAPFAGDNLIEYNDVHDAMTTAIDGAAIYVTFAHYGKGTQVRGNVVHDTHGNPFHEHWGAHPPSGGLYLDGFSRGGTYDNNTLYRNLAAGPLIFNYEGAQVQNRWIDNEFFSDGLPPMEYVHAVRSYAGIEPRYRRKLGNTGAVDCRRYELRDANASVSAIQYDLPSAGWGVVRITVHSASHEDNTQFQLRGLDVNAVYEIRAYSSVEQPQNVWGVGQMEMLDGAVPIDSLSIGVSPRIHGNDLLDLGLTLRLGTVTRAVWLVYKQDSM